MLPSSFRCLSARSSKFGRVLTVLTDTETTSLLSAVPGKRFLSAAQSQTQSREKLFAAHSLCEVKTAPKMHLDGQFLRVHWKAGDDEMYPLVWLRNNCQCPQCFDSSSLGRKILGRHLILDPVVSDMAIDPVSKKVTFIWHDGHESTYTFDWLLERGFSEERRAKRKRELHNYHIRRAWGRDFKPPLLDFNETIGSDEGIFKLLSLLKVYGLCILENAKEEEEPLVKISEIIGYPLPTNYGHYFSVKNKGDPSNLAYTSSTLGLHVDLALYTMTPGVQLLHCVQQTDDIEGGENYFSDAMFAGRRIREEDRKAFDLLVNEETIFWDYGTDFVKDFHLRNIRPTFRLDENEDVVEIAYNHQVRDSKTVIEPEKLPDWFRAIALLENVMMEEAVYMKLRPGQIVCFDNIRVLHGRNGYRMTNASADRHLRGVYYSWDEVNSKFRRLSEKFCT